MNTNLAVANTILEQLGGNRFVSMVGAKDVLGDAASLQFKIGTGAANGINCVRIVLAPSDTYEVTFYKLRGRKDPEVVSQFHLVTWDSLRSLFRSETGFEVSL